MEDSSTIRADDCVYRFVWVEPDQPALGGQWMAYPPEGLPWPVSLADVIEAMPGGTDAGDALSIHVERSRELLAATADLEDELFPDPTSRLTAVLAAAGTDEPVIEPETADGLRVRRAAEALEKIAADLAELVQEQLHDGGSLATLPPDSTTALCQAVQAGWRLRRLVEPPGPLYL